MAGSHKSAKFQQRYAQAQRYLIPQLQHTGRPLHKMRALEIGCGEAPKLCALAPLFEQYVGIDLDATGLAMGRENARALNITNADLRLSEADDLPQILANERFDVIILYAVLEHLTIEERLNTLRLCWDALPPEGLLYIGEAPNRITPIDYHSTRRPYFNMMQPELALRFIDQVGPERWRKSVRAEATPELGLYRYGQHVGFEEFELAIAPPEQLAHHLIADSWSEPMLNMCPLRWFEPRNLEDFDILVQQEFHDTALPPMFARYWLDGILAKTPMANPLPPVHFLTPHKTPPRPPRRGPLGVNIIGLNGKETAEFVLPHTDTPLTELMFGIDKQSRGSLRVKLGRKVLSETTVQDIFATTDGLWAPQTWRRIALPDTNAGQSLTIQASRGSWIGLCPPFVR